jgi:hypothetical protein
MFYNTDILIELAQRRCIELLKEAEDERQAKKVIRMQKQRRQSHNWSARLGHQLIQWGFRMIRPERAVGLVSRNVVAPNGGVANRSGQARRRIGKTPIATKPALPLYLFTRVTSEIEIETTVFGSYYLTYYRSPHRVAALERYATEAAARDGHHKWAGKNWSKRSFSEVVLEEET